MTKILELLKFLPALITAVMALVKSFEVPGFGAKKKEAVLAMVGLALDAIKSYLPLLPLDKAQLLVLVGKAIDTIVGFFNLIGLFRKGEPSVPPS